MYSVDTIRKVSKRLSRQAEDHMFERSVAMLKAMGDLPRRPPIPWRTRVWWRWQEYRGRVETAIEVLRGQHECGDW